MIFAEGVEAKELRYTMDKAQVASGSTPVKRYRRVVVLILKLLQLIEMLAGSDCGGE